MNVNWEFVIVKCEMWIERTNLLAGLAACNEKSRPKSDGCWGSNCHFPIISRKILENMLRLSHKHNLCFSLHATRYKIWWTRLTMGLEYLTLRISYWWQQSIEGNLTWEGFQVMRFQSIRFQVMREKSGEMDMEIHFKDAFRAFSKDDEGGHWASFVWLFSTAHRCSYPCN